MRNPCVILGNGPSLKGFALPRLNGVHSLGMNAAYRYWDQIGWYPTYYACLDDQLILSHHNQIHRLWQEGRIKRFFVHGTFFDHHPDCIGVPEFVSLDQALPHWYKQRGQAQGWPDLTGHPAFRTSDTTKVTTGAFATRFCAFLGHDTLALMGIDLKYVEILPEADKGEGTALVMRETPQQNPNYFFDSYQQAGDTYNIPNPDTHGNALHIQSFRLVASDFRQNGQKTRVYNTNPASLLQDEAVFALRPIDSFLTVRRLGAVVVPATASEVEALLANFDIWNSTAGAPALTPDPAARCRLAILFNNDTAQPQEDRIREKFAATGMERYFSDLTIAYLGLTGDDDRYERDYSRPAGPQGYKSGPNNQFFRTMQQARDLGGSVLQMETDCVPLRPDWLALLQAEVAQSGGFWVLGTRYQGAERLAPAFRNHLNGNAVYALDDPEFRTFLDTFWEPRTRQMVSQSDNRLAYDCILEKIFTEQAASDSEVARVLAQHGPKFCLTPLLLNLSGKRDVEEISPFYRHDLLRRYPQACLLHNRTAQKFAAEEALREAALDQRYKDLVARGRTRIAIYLPTDKIPLADKVRGLEHVRRIYLKDLDAEYRPRMRALRDQYSGTKRCFLIGNGPSLNQTDLSCLKDEVTFAVNGFFLKSEDLDWTPTFYCVEDHLVAEDRAQWINAYKGPIKFFPAYLGYMFPKAPDTIFFHHRSRISYPDGFDFSLEADEVTYTGCTVTFTMMQLAAYLGFQEIYLIGVDASYDIPADAQTGDSYGTGVLDMKSDDPNHFHPDYFGKGFRWHDPQVNKMVEAYTEARRVLEEKTRQRIYNATVGGQLEVFERRSFASLFPAARSPEQMAHVSAKAAAAQKADHRDRPDTDAIPTRNPDPASFPDPPRLLVIDMTAMGDGTATGEVKSNLLGGWPADRLLQVFSPKPDQIALRRPLAEGGYRDDILTEHQAAAWIAGFGAEIVLYRPVPDRPVLHRFAMAQLALYPRLPLAVWIMDDWPARAQATDPAGFAPLDADLRHLLARASLRLSISDAMSDAFATRYDVDFMAFANGIDPAAFTAPRQHAEGPVVVRYAGGLAPDMNAASLQRIARAIEARAEAGQDIRLEIATRPHWQNVSGALFDGLKTTRIETESRSRDAYVQWLCSADVLVIAYNFDEASQRYTRYSMANKMPECLASGAALLVHGPQGLATVDRLAQAPGGSAVAEVVSTPDEAALQQALIRLGDPAHRTALAGPARALALRDHDLTRLRGDLVRTLARSVQQAAEHQATATADTAAPLVMARLYLRGPDGVGAGFAPVSLADIAGRLAAGALGPGDLALAYADPATALAAALAQGQTPDQALAGWKRSLRRHLTLARSLAQPADAAPPIVSAGRIGRLGTTTAPLPSLPAVDPGHLVQARTALQGDAEARDILAAIGHSLPAMSAQPTTPSATPAPAAPRTDAALALAHEQLRQLRATLEVYHADAEALRAELGRLQSSRA